MWKEQRKEGLPQVLNENYRTHWPSTLNELPKCYLWTWNKANSWRRNRKKEATFYLGLHSLPFCDSTKEYIWNGELTDNSWCHLRTAKYEWSNQQSEEKWNRDRGGGDSDDNQSEDEPFFWHFYACLYCVYCKYVLCILYVLSNQTIPAGLRPQREAGRTTALCVVKKVKTFMIMISWERHPPKKVSKEHFVL